MTAPGLRLHPRTLPVQSAGADLSLLLIDWQDTRDLTDTETLGLLAEQVQRIHKRLLRAERHPGDPDRKADEA